ncbi:MAG: MBOAT family protein [Saprospiraceae bacterium]|nr:MBOAT family protein [Saprospiraceae bacterium]
METLKNIFLYSKEHPLIFTQFYFWAFFAIVLFGYTFLAKKRVSRSAYLLFASLFFYYKSSGFFFFILIFSTLVDFFIGKKISASTSVLKRKLLVALSICVNLSLLIYFKYSYFFIDTLNNILQSDLNVVNYLALWANTSTGTHFEVSQILLPVGISFFTFQTISYSIDVYRKKVEPVKNVLDFGFYVSFFPQLVAGPIVRAADFIPQLYEKFKLSRYEFGLAIFWILKGLVKKIFIGDYIAINFVDRVFTNPLTYTSFENLMALFGYSLQVYVDFSGYTDIAIGIALLMGFRLPTNFNSPYKAQNVGDFWKRWHISLSSWLKDYLYIPMGGNRKGTFFTYLALTFVLFFIISLSKLFWLVYLFAGVILSVYILARIFPKVKSYINTNINIMLTMLIGGLWHGASWQFVIWGGLNGIGIVTYKFWRKISPWEKKTGRISVIWKIAITFCFITFTRVFFRSESMEVVNGMLHQIGQMVNPYYFIQDLIQLIQGKIPVVTAIEEIKMIPTIIVAYKYVFAMMLFGFVTHWLSYDFKEKWSNRFINSPMWLQVLISAIVVFIVYQSISSEMQPFIYFQF